MSKISKISLKSLVDGCEKYWIDRRIVIVPNCSNNYKELTSEFDKKNRHYLIAKNREDLEGISGLYIIDFNQIVIC